jgi:hypothetical protein
MRPDNFGEDFSGERGSPRQPREQEALSATTASSPRTSPRPRYVAAAAAHDDLVLAATSRTGT